MSIVSKTSTIDYDPVLVDFLLEHRIARIILTEIDKLGSGKPERWVKVPDILRELGQRKELKLFKNLRSTVHHYCKRLYEKYRAIDRHKSIRPLYYRINEKGKLHLSKLQRGGKRKGEVDEKY